MKKKKKQEDGVVTTATLAHFVIGMWLVLDGCTCGCRRGGGRRGCVCVEQRE